jgi:hypothetical protein
MLEYSLKFAAVLFPKAERIVCINNLSEDVESIVSKMARNNAVDLLDVTCLLPIGLRNSGQKNSWWKYAPPRLAIEKYEIVSDNDVVLWKVPPTLSRSIRENALVALTDAAGQYYGDFQETFVQSNKNLRLNAGLIGMPPRFAADLESVNGSKLTDFFHSEQGFTAVNFARYQGKKNMISLDEVAQLNVMEIDADDLISKFCGGHFCGCSFGHYNFWKEKYFDAVKKRLSKFSS